MGLKSVAKSLLHLLPKQTQLNLRQEARWWRNKRQAAPYLGKGRVCACCGTEWREFVPAGKPPRDGEMCLRCGAGRRQRLLAGFLKRELAKRGGGKVLHFAPEVCLTKIVRSVPGVDYTSADIMPEFAMDVADICDLKYADAQFDVVLCTHVLEHVADDRAAMRQLVRVLKKTGVAYVMVPQDLERDQTYEDPTVVTEEDREREFGQYDHVRLYGRDFTDRLDESGFSVEVLHTSDIADEPTIQRNGLAEDLLYVCRPH